MSRPTFSQWGSGAAYIICVMALGTVLGAAVATRAMFTNAFGWDRPTDILVGLSIGGIVGLLFALATLKRYAPRRRIRIAAVALLAAALTLAFLDLLPGPPQPVASTFPGFMMPLGSSAALS